MRKLGLVLLIIGFAALAVGFVLLVQIKDFAISFQNLLPYIIIAASLLLNALGLNLFVYKRNR